MHIYVLFYMLFILTLYTCFPILDKIQDGDHVWWLHRPPGAPPPINIPHLVEKIKVFPLKAKLFGNITTYKIPKGGRGVHQPLLYRGGGMTLRVRPRVKVKILSTFLKKNWCNSKWLELESIPGCGTSYSDSHSSIKLYPFGISTWSAIVRGVGLGLAWTLFNISSANHQVSKPRVSALTLPLSRIAFPGSLGRQAATFLFHEFFGNIKKSKGFSAWVEYREPQACSRHRDSRVRVIEEAPLFPTFACLCSETLEPALSRGRHWTRTSTEKHSATVGNSARLFSLLSIWRGGEHPRWPPEVRNCLPNWFWLLDVLLFAFALLFCSFIS